jgi:sensitive to high expression protein 9
MDNLQSRVFVASQTLNDLTGYSAIEAIKVRNASLENDLHAAQARLRDARASYKDLTARRASTQREVTTLLARKDSWAPPDLERFTALYRLDHELEAGVSAAAAELGDAETDEDRLSAELNAGILKRYHEEQIWSDRIRRQSTWGTWGLMGVNVLLFLGFQFVAEPWRRRRLVKGIAEGERGVMDELRGEVAALRGLLTEMGGATAGRSGEERVTAQPEPVVTVEAAVHTDATPQTPVLDGSSSSWKEVLSDPERWQPALQDLYSERRIQLRMKDATVIAIEGAAAGAVIAAGVAFMLLRRT